MSFVWPCFGPCLYSKIAARVSWPSTDFQAFGDSPFKQWFRLSLLLVVVYWLSAYFEGMAAPKPSFNVIKTSANDLRAFQKVDKIFSNEALNVTGDGLLASQSGNVNTVIDQHMKSLDAVGEMPLVEVSMPEISPFAYIFHTIKWVCSLVWLVLVVMLRAHTRKQYAIPAQCCSCKVTGDVDFEDMLCSFCCQPCTLSQMATHTAAIHNDSPCDCCDAEDPGACDKVLVPLSSSSKEAPHTTNSMLYSIDEQNQPPV